MKELSFLNMLQISDSLFPIGAFTLSNGLETYVQQGKVQTAEDLKIYLEQYINLLPYNELGAMVIAYKNRDSNQRIQELDHLYAATRIPMEIRVGSEKLCRRFIKVWKKIKFIKSLESYSELICNKECYGHHPIAVGLFASEIQMNIKEAASTYAYSLLSSLVTNAVKTVPLSQLEGQRVLNETFEMIMNAVDCSVAISMEEIGIGGTEFEIAGMLHETLYSRLYMS